MQYGNRRGIHVRKKENEDMSEAELNRLLLLLLLLLSLLLLWSRLEE